MNSVTLTGYLSREPEIKQVNEKFSVMNNAITWTEKVKDAKKKHYFNFEAFNGTAQFIKNHFAKGKPIEIKGQLKTKSWEKDGQKHEITYVSVDEVSFSPRERTENNISNEDDLY